jgi:ABC-type antimicrobial peptide transport system permease subunit
VSGGPGAAGHERVVDGAFFGILGIPLRAGRLFDRRDTASGERAIVLSESLARTLFGDDTPIGRQVEAYRPATVVGVVGDVRYAGLAREAAPAYYVPFTQQPSELVCLVARVAPGVRGTAEAMRAAVLDIDPEQPVEKLTTVDRIVASTTADRRFYTACTAAFGSVAILLALGGVFGVTLRTVAERRRELAIRMALGADASRLSRLVVTSGLAPALAGAVAGLAAAAALSRLLARFLFEVAPLDPVAYVGAALLVTAMTLVGCYWPARLATRTDPMIALRAD